MLWRMILLEPPEASARKADRYSPSDELANSLTHAVGVALSVAGLVVLVTCAGLMGDAWRVVSFSVYGSSLVLLYLASTLYHAFRRPGLKLFFRRLDHVAIYLLIAGTYTPFTLVTLRGGWGWTLFGLIWVFALAGIVTTLLFPNRPRWSTAAIYVAMGWVAVIALGPLVAALPAGGLALVVAGGLAYTGGVAFYVRERFPFSHAVWHLFVLGGSIAHFFAVLLYVLPNAPA